jgi:hypothetical protein
MNAHKALRQCPVCRTKQVINIVRSQSTNSKMSLNESHGSVFFRAQFPLRFVGFCKVLTNG